MIIIACQGRLRLHSNWYSIYLFVFFSVLKLVVLLCLDGAKGAQCIDMAFMLSSG
jgi:hypothetical protein